MPTITPSDEAFHLVDVYPVRTERHVGVDVPLWTAEEGGVI